jgi:MFS family permease
VTGIVENESVPFAAATIKTNFIVMSLFFSLNLASCTTVISFAAADFASVGNYSNGLVFLGYMLSALFLAKVVIAWGGSKTGLLVGLCGYTCYLVMYFVCALLGPEQAGWLVLVGSCIGGVGSGVVWVSQGTYMTESAALYAVAAGIPQEQATSVMSWTFATTFAVFEVVMTSVGAVIKQSFGNEGTKLMYGVLACFGLLSILGVSRVLVLKKEKEDITRVMVLDKALAGIRLLRADLKMILMLPYQIAFSFNGAFLNGFISPQVTAMVLSNATIGYFSSLIALTAALVSFGAGCFIQRTGIKWPLMLLGAVAFFALAFPFLIQGDASDYTSWKVMLLYIALGVGRGTWESSNKAVVADLFGARSSAGFANIMLADGVSSAVAYFLFPSLTPYTKALVCCVVSVIGFACYYAAHILHRRPKEEGGVTLMTEADRRDRL